MRRQCIPVLDAGCSIRSAKSERVRSIFRSRPNLISGSQLDVSISLSTSSSRLTRLPRDAVSWTCPIVTFELHAVQTPLAGPYKTEGLNF